MSAEETISDFQELIRVDWMVAQSYNRRDAILLDLGVTKAAPASAVDRADRLRELTDDAADRGER